MGFFDSYKKEEIQLTHTTSCSTCRLFKSCSHPSIPKSGNGTNGIVVILPPVSREEDLMGVSGTGSMYDWLRDQFREVDINFDDCTLINSVACYHSDVKGKHFDACSARWKRVLREVKPRLVISLGTENLPVILGDLWTRNIGDTVKWSGFQIPWREYNCWLACTFSPKEILYQESFYKNERWKKAISAFDKAKAVENNGNYRIYTREFRRDIRDAYLKSFEDIPKDPAKVSPVTYTTDNNAIIAWLKDATTAIRSNNYKWLCCDLETTGLKPYNNGHKIYSMALMYNEAIGSLAFLVNDTILPYLQELFSSKPRILGANWKFDYNWLRLKANIDASNLVHDVCIASHLLWQKDGITSLKFNTLCKFGISYEDTVHSYLVSEGTNGINNIEKAPVDDLLYYNALDVCYTHYCALEQEKEWALYENKNKQFAWDLYHKGSIALAKIELNGMKMDLKRAEQSRAVCEQHLKEIDEAIKDHPVWLEWQSIYGDKASLLSDAQIIDIFIKRKGLWPDGISKRKKPKADREWLSKMINQEPFIQYILEKRRWDKINTTYLDSFFKETNDDGKIRCFYSCSNVASYRMSASEPNLTNQSSRDGEMVELLKSCFVFDDDELLVSCDFSGLENNISANITKDPVMTASLDGGVDLHKSNALYMFCTNEEEFAALKAYDNEHHTKLAKSLRNGGKTASFSALFGAMQDVVGESLWKTMFDANLHVTPTETAYERVRKVLRMDERYADYVNSKKGNLTQDEFFYQCYEEHAKAFLDDFWNNKLKVTKEWRDSSYESFVRNGYFEYPTGLRVRGIMSRNAMLNSPVQGSGANVTLWCLIRLQYLIEKYNYPVQLIYQIHDDIGCRCKREFIPEWDKIMHKVMCEETKKVFPWLDTPLQTEPEYSNTSWANKQADIPERISA